MTTPNNYIEDCVKKFDEVPLCMVDQIDKNPPVEYVRTSLAKTYLTSSLNGLLDLLEKEVEGRKIINSPCGHDKRALYPCEDCEYSAGHNSALDTVKEIISNFRK